MRLTPRGEFVLVNVVVWLMFTAIQVAVKEPKASAEEPLPVVVVEAPWHPEDSKKHARSLIDDYGWNVKQFSCLEQLWTKESNWRHKAQSKVPIKVDGEIVYAGGIPQILGLDPATSPKEQIVRGLDYIVHRYDNPCNAWAFWLRQAGENQIGGWY